jgi:hypothetical protein
MIPLTLRAVSTPRRALVVVVLAAALVAAWFTVLTGDRAGAGAAAGDAAAHAVAGLGLPAAIPGDPPPVRLPPAPRGDAGRRTVQAAPWPLGKVETDFYRMVLLPDGFPGKRVGARVLPHPIWGTYLIDGFLRAYQRTHDVRSLRALLVVARAAVRRMKPFHGGLVFWYEPGRSVTWSGMSRREYSALTQAYYTNRLSSAAVATGAEDLRAAAVWTFRSLLVSTALGGVSSPGKVGPVLEEAPQSVPSAILNGWLSALASVKRYAARTGSEEATALLRSSAREAAARLGRYDLASVLGIAYAGLGRVTLRLDVPRGTAVTRASLEVDGRSIPLRLAVSGSASDVVRVVRCGVRRAGKIVATCPRLLVDVPVTSAGIAGTNIVRLTLRSAAGAPVRGTLHRGIYRYVHDRGRSVVGWTGRQLVRGASPTPTMLVSLSEAQIRAALTPTTFKRLGGHRINSYHRIPVQRLRELAVEGGPAFTEYANRWSAYACRWRGHPAYRLLPARDLTCQAGG